MLDAIPEGSRCLSHFRIAEFSFNYKNMSNKISNSNTSFQNDLLRTITSRLDQKRHFSEPSIDPLTYMDIDLGFKKESSPGGNTNRYHSPADDTKVSFMHDRQDTQHPKDIMSPNVRMRKEKYMDNLDYNEMEEFSFSLMEDDFHLGKQTIEKTPQNSLRPP